MKNNWRKIKNKKAISILPAGRQVARQGFSLMEVMLVVFILSTSLVVFIQVITKSINHSMESRDAIIAAGLAQEGVELVKNIRDNNWAKKRTVFAGINSGTIDYNDDTCKATSVILYYGNSFYNHDGIGSATKFSRRITITGTDTKNITSMVIWEKDSFPGVNDCNTANKCVYAIITLTKWGGE